MVDRKLPEHQQRSGSAVPDGAAAARALGGVDRSIGAPFLRIVNTVIVVDFDQRGEAHMKVTGACHCGQITYEAEIDPARVGICNCTDCQVLTGSAFRVSVPAPAASFRLLTGTPKVYVKTADSGARRRHSFCPNCGAPVAASADSDDPPSYSLRVGCLAQKAKLPPQRRIWCKSALPWSQDVSGIPGIEGQ